MVGFLLWFGIGVFLGGGDGGLFFPGQFQGNQLQQVITRRLLPLLKSEVHSGHCYSKKSAALFLRTEI